MDLPLKRRMPKNIEKFSDKSNIHRVSHSHFEAKKDQRISVKHLFERLNFSITGNTIIVVDVGDSLFGALDLTIHGQTEFLSPAYYLSMGFAVPAAIGVQLANPKLRPIVIVGDGAFQMTGMAMVQKGLYLIGRLMIYCLGIMSSSKSIKLWKRVCHRNRRSTGRITFSCYRYLF
jgi:TPP-dependent 2-oxoacid decarboxylase